MPSILLQWIPSGVLGGRRAVEQSTYILARARRQTWFEDWDSSSFLHDNSR